MPNRKPSPKPVNITAVDLFCGAGGLTRGLLDAGISVAAGYDIDEACRYPYVFNNTPARFHKRNVSDLTGEELAKDYPKGHIRVLVGCAPCVPFSSYSHRFKRRVNPKWGLLYEFARLIRELKPDIVSMENVPGLQHHCVFESFLATLRDEGYCFPMDADERVVSCPDYGIAQRRARLVIVASRLGPIELVRPTHRPSQYRTVWDVLSSLPPIASGEVSTNDPLHRASRLSPLNQRRIRRSTAGGTWRDWPRRLVAECHKNETGKSYPSVYGRMEWEQPSPTITTQFFGFGNGRFGHPEQDRGLSLREGALLQSFPRDYGFVKPGGRYHIKTIGRLIGNAVPVRLGEIVGRTIKRHVQQYVH